ncbi:MAG: ferritin family protein [Candidatus Asgardarchaeia archaeon]
MQASALFFTDTLLRAWANEWISFFYYLFLTGVARFKGYPDLSEELEYITNEELEHAEFLEDVLFQFAVIPKRDWKWIEKTAHCSKLFYPESMILSKKVFSAIKKTKLCLFENYEKLMILTYETDQDFYHSIQKIIEAEERHYELLVNIKKMLL